MNDSVEKLQQAAQRVINTYARISNETMGTNLPIPVPVSFDLCETNPTWAGAACSSIKIQVNMILFEQDVHNMLNQTLPHEVAHLVQYDKFSHKGLDIQNHGAEWQEIMKRFGKKPNKHHTVDVTKAKEWHKQFKRSKKT